MSRPRIGVFRPDDGRLDAAIEFLESLGAEVVGDPMLAVVPTGESARVDADYVVLTSTTGVSLLAEKSWDPGDAIVCAIGPRTAKACEDAGYDVEIVPGTYSSEGLVGVLETHVAGARIEVARSDHGSDVLLDGINDAGGYVHESVLYELVRPAESGWLTEEAAAGRLDAVLFTSSLTVTNFLDAAAERGIRSEAIRGVNTALVGVIGVPTRVTAADHGIQVDVVPEDATFESLSRALMDQIPREDE